MSAPLYSAFAEAYVDDDIKEYLESDWKVAVLGPCWRYKIAVSILYRALPLDLMTQEECDMVRSIIIGAEQRLQANRTTAFCQAVWAATVS